MATMESRRSPAIGLPRHEYTEVPQTPPNTPQLPPDTIHIPGRPEIEANSGDICHTPLPEFPLGSTVITQEPGGDSGKNPTRTRLHSRPPNFLGLAVLVALCNCPLGLLATVFACLSRGDYSRGDIDGARSKGQVAKWLSIIGFVSSVLIAVMVTVYFLVIERNIVRFYEELQG